MGQEFRGCHTQKDADDAAHQGQGKGLDEKLKPDVPGLCPYSHADANFAGPFRNRDQHDIHDADAAH